MVKSTTFQGTRLEGYISASFPLRSVYGVTPTFGAHLPFFSNKSGNLRNFTGDELSQQFFIHWHAERLSPNDRVVPVGTRTRRPAWQSSVLSSHRSQMRVTTISPYIFHQHRRYTPLISQHRKNNDASKSNNTYADLTSSEEWVISSMLYKPSDILSTSKRKLWTHFDYNSE